MKVSAFQSPAYGVKRVKINDLVSQKANPNQMTGKAWEALQTSIFNSGYTFPVISATNDEYDPSTEGQPKPDLIEHKDDESIAVTNTEGGMQVADDEISKYFKYRLIDGAHRTQIIRLGTYYFHQNIQKYETLSDSWFEGREIPERPGVDMLAYLAWRENFTIPCVIREIDATQQMSEEILHNTARGSHSLDSMKDIVYNLINVAGMSEDWVSRNLYLDLESIKRMQQLSGLKASFQDIDDADLAWSPEKDQSFQRKTVSLLTREASKFLEIFRRNHENDPEALQSIPTYGTAVDQALAVGFDKESVWTRNSSVYEEYMELQRKES